MFNLYTYEKMQKEHEKYQKEKIKFDKYILKRKSKYFNNNLSYRK